MRLCVLGFIFTGGTANSMEDHINHVLPFVCVCVCTRAFVCVCACVSLNVTVPSVAALSMLCYFRIHSPHAYTHTHTQDLAGHLEESKQRIFHQLCELAIFGPAVTALHSICLR